MKKEDTINKLEQREARRRQSIVKAMISDPQPAAQRNPAQKQKPLSASPLDFIKAPDKETRSKRVSTLLRPSIHRKAQQKCERLGISLNDAINQFLERFVQEG